MSEYIYGTDSQEGHWLTGEEIVRCRDCVFFTADVSTVDERGEQIATGNLCEWTELWTEPDGFCAWAERANFVTCKCGEDIELGERESAVCPRCNRTVRA